MPYDNYGNAPQAELQSIHSRLSTQNSDYVTILNEIEDRLHSILNLRQPQVESKDSRPPTPLAPDMVSQLHEQLNYLSSHNKRLQQVLDHIRKLIG